jgi:hypothetical protein
VVFTGTKGAYVMDHRDFEIYYQDGNKTTIVKGWHPKEEGWRYYRNIADHMVEGTPLVISAEWARRPIHILDLANKSAEAGRAMRAKYG